MDRRPSARSSAPATARSAAVSETEARRAVRELIAMLVEEEAPGLGVEPRAHPDSRPALAWGSCSTTGTFRSTGASCSRRSKCSTTSSCTSSATCARRITRAGSGSSWRRAGPTGVRKRLARRARARAARVQAVFLGPQVRVAAVEPVLARRVEDVDVEHVLERLGLVRQVRRDVQHLAGADVDDLGLVVAEPEAERTFEDVGQLLVLVECFGTIAPCARYTCAIIILSPLITAGRSAGSAPRAGCLPSGSGSRFRP